MSFLLKAQNTWENFAKYKINDYAKLRNFDFGPNNESSVSKLSPFITHRILSEYDLINDIKSKYKINNATKFVEEIFWRVYWKGWLEHRPQVWNDYYEYSDKNLNSGVYKKAIEGTTGIACFDNWVEELVNENYLHNHTRMWFASIWIFTLNLPWQLGANFFMKHLLDGDSASNTLSWRWVAGLQTIGKHYLATASNISKFTNNVHKPLNLNENALPLHENKTYDLIDINYSNTEQSSDTLLMCDNDLSFKDREGMYTKYKCIYLVQLSNEFRRIELSDNVLNYKYSILEEFSNNYPQSKILNGNDLKKEIGINKNIDVIYPCVGENHSFLENNKNNSKLNYIYRHEDLFCWKYAKKGFFNFKKNIPLIIEKIIKTKDFFI